MGLGTIEPTGSRESEVHGQCGLEKCMEGKSGLKKGHSFATGTRKQASKGTKENQSKNLGINEQKENGEEKYISQWGHTEIDKIPII